MSAARKCKDCMDEWGGFPPPACLKRPTPYPGPRCATHHRKKTKETRRSSWERHILKTYGITGVQYDELLKAQEGTCFICRRANGLSRKLSVDHDHKTGYVRGLLCRPCNNVLGHLRDDPEAAARIVMYLMRPPAFETIGRVKPSECT